MWVQVWWPILITCALRPGSSWGFGALLKGLTSVVVSKVERTLVVHSPHQQFLPDPRFEPTTSGYKSDALSIRPRLPQDLTWELYLLVMNSSGLWTQRLTGPYWPANPFIIITTFLLIFIRHCIQQESTSVHSYEQQSQRLTVAMELVASEKLSLPMRCMIYLSYIFLYPSQIP